jgi:hypothetical protein
MGMPPTPGAPPPGLSGGVGPASSPGGMAGAAQQGMTAVKLAVDALQKALPSLPMGTPLHGAVVKAVADISKHMEGQGSAPDQNAILQQLMQMARGAQQQPQQNAMMQAFPAGGAGGAGGGAPPPGPGAG